MNKKWVLTFCMIACLFAYGCGKDSSVFYPELYEGAEAPDFTAQLADGRNFTLSEQEGKVVLLNFWATWCSPCVGEMPAFEKLYKEYGDQIEMIAVNSGEEKAVVEAFLEEKNYTFPIAFDETGEISNKYPSEGIPYTLVIGKDGRVEAIFTGAKDAETQYKLYKRALRDAFEGE